MKITSIGESSPGVEVETSDINLDPQERVTLELFVKDDAVSAMVLLEGNAEIEIAGVDVRRPALGERVKLFFTGALRRGQRIAIHIRSEVQTRVTLSVAFARREFGKAWDKLPCTGCKLLVRMITHAVLAHVGVPSLHLLEGISVSDVSDHAIMLVDGNPQIQAFDASQKATLLKFINIGDQSDLGNFLTKLPSWDVIKDVFEAFGWAFEAVDRFYAWPCKKLGCCPG